MKQGTISHQIMCDNSLMMRGQHFVANVDQCWSNSATVILTMTYTDHDNTKGPYVNQRVFHLCQRCALQVQRRLNECGVTCTLTPLFKHGGPVVTSDLQQPIGGTNYEI